MIELLEISEPISPVKITKKQNDEGNKNKYIIINNITTI
jgi:hypothetical protein